MINLLITGGCGFIGSNFINYIFGKNKYKIINLDAMYYCADEKNVNEDIRNSENYVFIKGNINDKDLVNLILNNYKIEYIIHFAAQSHVDNSFSNPLQYTYDNIMGTHNLLEEVKKYGKIKKFIHVSTDEVYGESMLDIDEKHKTEHSILCPTNPYAATKAGAELITQSYQHSFKLPIIITRGNNVYGPNQYPEKLIPKFIDLLKNNKKCTIAGTGSAIRNFIHVNDVCTAVEIIINKGILGEVYNIGGNHDNEYSVMDVAKKLIKLIKNSDNESDYIEYMPDRPFNDTRYFISNDKLTNLGWEQKIMFDKGLELLVWGKN